MIISGLLCNKNFAKFFLKQSKGHNRFEGCDKCVDKGIYFNRRKIFLDFSATKRTNDNFQRKTYIEHHIGVNPLERLEIDLVMSFLIDYMHNVCLGVMRKMLFLWRDERRLYRICVNNLLLLKNNIITLQKMASRI